jgi:carbonic anhydrase/acetyltransferase-like protein (isoleucine patch superfamily)
VKKSLVGINVKIFRNAKLGKKAMVETAALKSAQMKYALLSDSIYSLFVNFIVAPTLFYLVMTLQDSFHDR